VGWAKIEEKSHGEKDFGDQEFPKDVFFGKGMNAIFCGWLIAGVYKQKDI